MGVIPMQDNILLAAKYLEGRGYEPYECESEDEARARVDELKSAGRM